ncbi:hypothetical protein GDO81_016285 [Engystomops pustulosus]|uniref:Uncharacterized protein n=1 Tax=Engystomops pustulosus TaxID=76066 RepID=A0AAV7ATC9_ENGPU|nr:hypothetical protein GDO81_016285 [Engystomops pustulosus]
MMVTLACDVRQPCVPLGAWVLVSQRCSLHVPVVIYSLKSQSPVSGRIPWFLLILSSHVLAIGPLIKMSI